MKFLDEAVEYIKILNNGGQGETYLNSFSNTDQYRIMMSAKVLLAHAAVDKGANMRGACYNCKYRTSIPGDVHSGCKSPLAIVIGDEHGIQHGWFLHPFNFDPVWLTYCDSFEGQ